MALAGPRIACPWQTGTFALVVSRLACAVLRAMHGVLDQAVESAPSGGERVSSHRSPSLARRRLGLELRRLRDGNGLTLEQAAHHLGCSDSKLSRIEKGQVGATPQDVSQLLALYGTDPSKRDELMQLTEQARRRPWWEVEFSDLPLAYASHLAAAVEICTYQVLLVPGLLQTEDYARAVLRALRSGLDPPDVEGRVEIRTRQQAILTRPNPTRFHAVLDEAVLRRPIGSAAMMRQQLKQLLEWTDHPNVTVQVLRFASGEHAGMDGAFMLFTFDDAAGLDVVYLENTANDVVLEQADMVARYRVLFAHLCEQALDPTRSRSFISKASKDL
jgi:transcriptional regulator with XRE-family HTH domain